MFEIPYYCVSNTGLLCLEYWSTVFEILLCYGMLCDAVLCYVMVWYAVICDVMLCCYVMLWYEIGRAHV